MFGQNNAAYTSRRERVLILHPAMLASAFTLRGWGHSSESLP